MTKTVKWHTGVHNMVNKTEARKDIHSLMKGNTFRASKSNFTLLSSRYNLGGWKNAVSAIVNKTDVDIAQANLATGSTFCLNKTELRRAANLT